MAEPRPISYDAPLGRRIIDLHVWAVRQGLLGIGAAELFDRFCRRLIEAGVPLWRGYTAMETLHPQWGGYGYTWRRDLNAIEPGHFERTTYRGPVWFDSPFAYLVNRRNAPVGESHPWRHLRRRLAGPEAQLDFPILNELAAGGATDYFAEIVGFGADGDPSWGTGIGYSFASDQPEGFRDDHLQLLKAVLPVVSLAMMAHAGHTIASGLLEAYLGADAGRRVHSGAVERGSVEGIRAVLWYADIRAYTVISDTTPGAVVVELLDEIFETLTASLRPRGGEVLKFLGDGMLAIFPFEDATREQVCGQALDAAAGRRQAGSCGRLGAPPGRGALRQCRRRRPARLYRDRAGGQRSRAHRG